MESIIEQNGTKYLFKYHIIETGKKAHYLNMFTVSSLTQAKIRAILFKRKTLTERGYYLICIAKTAEPSSATVIPYA